MDLFEAIAARHSYRGAFRMLPCPGRPKKIVERGSWPLRAATRRPPPLSWDDPFLLKRLGELVPKKAVQTARP
jgi:hypothetical protein